MRRLPRPRANREADNRAHAAALHQDAGSGQRLRRARRDARAARSRRRADCAASATGASASAPTRCWSSSRAPTPGVDFGYRIFNGAAATRSSSAATARAASCASCASAGLTRQDDDRASSTMNRRLELRAAGRRPRHGRHGRARSSSRRTCRSTPPGSRRAREAAAARSGRSSSATGAASTVAVVSMGNPHAVQVVADVDAAPVATQGPLIERHARFPRGVNAGFMQVVARDAHPAARLRARRRRDARLRHRRLRGGRGGIRLGLLDAQGRRGDARRPPDDRMGGRRRRAGADDRARAETVFEGEIEL